MRVFKRCFVVLVALGFLGVACQKEDVKPKKDITPKAEFTEKCVEKNVPKKGAPFAPLTGELRLCYSEGQWKKSQFFKAGKRHGKHVEWYENGFKRYECNFDNDLRDGLCQMWYDDGQKAHQLKWEKGKRVGSALAWYPSGQKISEVQYKDGKAYGKATNWYPNGQKRMEGAHKKDGAACGQISCWDYAGGPITCPIILRHKEKGCQANASGMFCTPCD